MQSPNRTFFLFFLFLSPLFLPSCGGNDPNDPGNRLSGRLSGRVFLQDEVGNPIADNSGAVISMEGTPYSTTSNADGDWKFDDLPTGTYLLSITKEGFTTQKQFGFQFVGGGKDYLGDVAIMKIPTYTINNLRVEKFDTGASGLGSYLAVMGTISPSSAQSPYNTIQFYLGRDAGVSKEPGKFVGMIELSAAREYEGIPPLSNGDFRFAISPYLAQKGFAKGEQIYIVAYPCAPSTGTYYDPEQRKTIDTRTSPNASNVTSFVW